MYPLTLNLSDPQANVETVGGKGMSLAKLANAGFPVPEAFHITTELTANLWLPTSCRLALTPRSGRWRLPGLLLSKVHLEKLAASLLQRPYPATWQAPSSVLMEPYQA